MGTYRLQSIADLDRARRERSAGRATAVTARVDLTAEGRLRLALGALRHNQSFVALTDAKANSLLLVNSIFIASTAAGGLDRGLALAAAGAAALVVLLCLGVVWARQAPPARAERGQLILFSHVLRRRTAAAYLEDFRAAGPEELIENTVRQVHELAGVVGRKFRAYRWAQQATVLSAGLWLARLVAGAG
jgi:hypothetical protein